MAKGIMTLIGTNDVGDFKKLRTDPRIWAGGMFSVWPSGCIYLSNPYKRVGRLPKPLKASDFLGWLRKHGVHIDKIYSPAANEFTQELTRLWNVAEAAYISGIVAQISQSLPPTNPLKD